MKQNMMASMKYFFVLAISGVALSLAAIPAHAAAQHQVRAGDSLYKIAVNNGTTVNELKKANGLAGDIIQPDQKLVIPSQPVAATAVERSRPDNGHKDVDLLAKLVAAEAGAEPFKGKVAVAAVILNRTEDKKFPATISGNIFKPHEFESVSNGLIWKQPVGDAYRAVSAALKGWDPTNGAKYFFNPGKAPGRSWVWTRTITDRIGRHVFAV